MVKVGDIFETKSLMTEEERGLILLKAIASVT